MRNHMIRSGLVLAAAPLVLAGLSACSTNAGGDGGGGDSTKMGVTVSNSTNPFFVKETDTAKSTGESMGFEVLSQEAQEDVSTQSNQIDQFVTSRVDFIVIDPVDSDGVGPAVKRAVAAGIPVVGIDSQTANADVSVTTDNVQAGTVSCTSLVEQLKGKGKVAILDGTPISSVQDRVKGCMEVLEGQPGIEVVAKQRGDNSRDKALPIATDILTAHPDIDAFFAINDPSAAGVELAAKQKGAKIIITSVDGAQAAIDSITGGGMITATAAQDPAALAKRGVELGADLAKGKKPEKDLIELPTELIDASNAADYKPWG